MSFSQFFQILWARRWVVGIATLTCFLAAVTVGVVLPPRYSADARLMFDNFKPDPITGEVMSTQFARAYISTQIELIKDQRTAGRVVDKLEWTASPELAAAYRKSGADGRVDFRGWLAERVAANTNAALVPGSNILEISYVATNAAGAARVAEAVREAYIDQAVSTKRNEANDSATWLRGQVERLRAELTAAEKRKTDFERANGIVLQADNTDTDTARLAAMTGVAATAGVAPVASGGGGGVDPVAAQLAQADAAIASAARVLGPNNPELLAMKRQRDVIAATPRARATGGGGGRSVEAAVQAQYSAQQRKVLASRGAVAKAQELASDVQVLREQYAKTSARAAELQQQGETEEAGITSLGLAAIPTAPSFPRWPLIILGSLVAGAGLGVLAGLALELANRRVRTVEDLAYDGVPVMGVAPRAARWSRA